MRIAVFSLLVGLGLQDPPGVRPSKDPAEALRRLWAAVEEKDDAAADALLAADRRFLFDVVQDLVSSHITVKARGEAGHSDRAARIIDAFARFKDLGDAEKRQIDALRARLALADRLSAEQCKNYLSAIADYGGLLQKPDRSDEALRKLEAAGKRVEALGDEYVRGVLCASRGTVLFQERRWSEALPIFEQAAEILKGLGESRWQSSALTRIGACHYYLGRYNKTLPYHEEALKLERALGDRDSEATTLNFMGMSCSTLGRLEDALRWYDESLAASRQVGNRQLEGTTLGNIGLVMAKQGRTDEAAKKYEEALKIKREVADRAGQATTLANLGDLHRRRGRADEALRCFEAAAKINEETGDRQAQAGTQSGTAAVYAGLGRYAEAMALYEQALKIVREIGNRAEEGIALGNMARVYRLTGRYEEALSHYEMALKIAREIGDRLGEGIDLGNIGLAHHELGRYQEALRFHLMALKIKREAGARAEVGITLGNLGRASYALGRYLDAMMYFEESLKILQEVGDREQESYTLGNMGLVHATLREFDKALRCQEQALKIKRELGHRAEEGVTLENIAVLYGDLDRHDEAVKAHEAALEIARSRQDAARQTLILGNLGFEFARIRRYEEAWKYYEQAKPENLNPSARIELLGNIGSTLLELRRLPEAIQKLDEGIRAAESTRAQMGSGESARMSWSTRTRWIFELAASARLLNREPESAFGLLEQMRSRSMLDRWEHAGRAAQGVEPRLLEAKEALVKRLNRVRGEIDSLSDLKDEKDRNAARVRFLELQAERLKIEAELIKAAQEIELQRKVDDVKPLTAAEIRSCLKDDEALVLYSGMTRRKILVSLLSRKELEVVEIDPPDAFEADLRWFREAAMMTGKGYPAAEFQKRARRLYDILIRPLQAKLDAGKFRRLIVAPDAQLYGIPFEALAPAENYLIGASEIEYVYSGTLLARMRGESRPPTGKKFVALGDPNYGSVTAAASRGAEPIRGPEDAVPDDLKPFVGESAGVERKGWSRLPNSADEVKRSSELFPESAVFLGDEASERNARKIENARIIHFACHGHVNADNSMHSALVLTADKENDGYLEAREIADLKLPCELVVLSACDSASGEMLRGEGLIGLTRAFMIAGARSVIASLWTVSDEGGKEFMVSFYKKLAAGKDKAAALAETKREFIKHAKYSAPYYWAGFVLHGD